MAIGAVETAGYIRQNNEIEKLKIMKEFRSSISELVTNYRKDQRDPQALVDKSNLLIADLKKKIPSLQSTDIENEWQNIRNVLYNYNMAYIFTPQNKEKPHAYINLMSEKSSRNGDVGGSANLPVANSLVDESIASQKSKMTEEVSKKKISDFLAAIAMQGHILRSPRESDAVNRPADESVDDRFVNGSNDEPTVGSDQELNIIFSDVEDDPVPSGKPDSLGDESKEIPVGEQPITIEEIKMSFHSRLEPQPKP